MQHFLQPSDASRTLSDVLLARMICTDDDCAEEAEAIGTAAETDFVLCAGCGCLMAAVAFEETEEALPAPSAALKLAA